MQVRPAPLMFSLNALPLHTSNRQVDANSLQHFDNLNLRESSRSLADSTGCHGSVLQPMGVCEKNSEGWLKVFC